MSIIYDEEYMIKDFEQTFLDKFNTEITKINNQKGAVIGDDLFLEAIPADKYIFEVIDETVLNFKGFFVLFGMVDTPPKDASITNFIEDVKLTFQVATFDKGEKNRRIILYKLLRYRKAIKNVVFDSPDIFREYAKPLVSSLRPDGFPYDNKNIILTCGVHVTASITAR